MALLSSARGDGFCMNPKKKKSRVRNAGIQKFGQISAMITRTTAIPALERAITVLVFLNEIGHPTDMLLGILKETGLRVV